MTLRRRVLLGLMVLVGVGMVLTDGALWLGLRTYLYSQVDAQLLQFINSHEVDRACAQQLAPPGGFGSSTPGLPATSYIEYVATDGSVLCSSFLDATVAGNAAVPVVPTSFGTGGGPALLTPFGGSTASGASYRMLAESVTVVDEATGSQQPAYLVVAIPISSLGATLGRLLLIEVVATVAVLATLGVAAWSMIRVGLRPLDAMTETAGAIAAGDLSRRVPAGDPRTEVGRLGAAMNSMLAQIETAFAAREASEARLRRFVADASHELRTPLTSIRGYAELFRRGASRRPEDLATAMRRIEEESTRMSSLVDDLLQLARLDVAAAEHREPVRQPTDLAALAADAAADLHAVEPQRPVSLEAAPAPLLADPDALRQVAANLLTNARHHTPATAAVTVRTGVEADGAQVFLEVADEGPGMSEADAAHVFERFWRADPARTRGHGGAGLGLSIVAAIVEQHGGRVLLHTAPGAGSRFRVELPAGAPPAAAASTGATAATTGGGRPDAGLAGDGPPAAPPTGAPPAAPADPATPAACTSEGSAVSVS